MHVKGFLHKLLGSVIHINRVNVLSDVVHAAIVSKELNLTALGRAIELPIKERSGIQKVNRLLGNEHLLVEYQVITSKVSDFLIGRKERPVIIIDWTKYPNSDDVILRASLALEGRALTLYEECHDKKYLGNRARQATFLSTLKQVIPSTSRPIIVTDAGFGNDWFKTVLKLGWDYVGRVRGIKKYRALNSNRFVLCSRLFRQATHEEKSLGRMVLTRKNPTESYFYLVKHELKGRKAFTKLGKKKQDKDSRNYARSYREPWLLVSSLRGRDIAKKIRRIYESRMSIEEAFRDLKSSKYGLGLEKGMTRKKRRRDIILLVAMLACLIAWITGWIGEKMGLHYQFQSNSIKHRRVISVFYVGCRLITKRWKFSIEQIWHGIASIQREAI